MPARDPVVAKATRERWLQRNPDHWQRSTIYRLRREFTARIAEIKLERGCIDCGFNAHPAALDFDHVRGEKFAIVGRMAGTALSTTTWESIEAEISKCEVRCANCHRIRTMELDQPRLRKRKGQTQALPADPTLW